MTQEQRQWLLDNGYDPAVYDVDEQGNVFENPIEQARPKQVMSAPRAFGTSFLGSVLPSAAGLYAGAQAGALGGSLAGPVGSVLGAIGGGLAGGYGAGKVQEAALERFAPEAVAEMQRAQTDQPVASYLGGFAPNALALRPSLAGIKGLTAPAMGMSREATRAAFMPAAVNVGANVAGATAGQLVDLAQGGEFSTPRFAADVALGSLFSDPTRIGRRLGLQPLTPETAAPERLDLAGRRGELAAAEAARADEAASARATELLGGEAKPAVKSLDQIVDPRRTNIEENRRAIEKTLTGLTKETPPADLVQDLANDPFVGNLRDDPAALQEFIFNKADKYLQQAFARGELAPEFTGQMMGAMRERAEAFTPEGGVRVAPADWVPTSERVTRQPATTEEVLGRAPVAEEGTPLEQAIKPTPEEIAKAEKIQAENARIEAEQNAAELQKLQDLEAAQALSDEAAARLEALQARQAELLRLAERAPAVIRRGVAEQGAPDIAQAKQELADARAIADDLLARLQRAGGEGQITQADLDAAAQLAARRGLKIEFTTPEQQAKGIRGAYLTNEAGERVIYIDANAATPDTAIHEIGHDVFERSAGERMKKGLMATAEDSPAFKAEYEARLKEGVSEQRARDLALEEGVVQAFGEKYPNVPQGEIRSWFNALKASLKSMVGMRLSPEDAARWLHYATTEAVPWKGAVAVKSGEERLQRAQQETPEFKNWFGESQVVDEQGKPLVVYHGTSKDVDFTSFKGNKNGIWFTPDPNVASSYATQNDSMGYRRGVGYSMEPTNTASRVIPAYVSLKNPAVFDVWPDVIRYATNYKKALGDYFTQLKAQGHDGVIFGSGKEKTYVAFNPEQVKSATANKGTFSPESKDIRYQRGLGSEIKTPSELDYLTSKGGPFAEVARGLRDAYNTRDYKQGQWSSKYSLTTKLPEEARVRLLNHLAGEFDSGVLKAPAQDIKAAYDQIRKDYLPAIVNDYNSKGFMVRDTAGLRARGSNPTYFPLHAVADEVKTILTTKQGSPEYTKLENDFKQWNTQLKQADGATLAEAKRYADEKFADMQNIVAKPPGIESGVSFAGARKPEGYPLPPSWRSDDIIDILNNYTRRSATDYAYQSHVESSPVAMAALGAKTMLNNQPIPANVLQSTTNIVTDPSVQSVLREYRGTPAQKTEGLLQSAGRLTSAATIGTVSKVGDIGTSMFKGLAYLPGSEYAAGLSQFVNKIADWAALKERSYASGLNKRDAAENMRQVFGIAEDSTAFMDKAARVLSKVTFVNDLESVARVIAQGWGETVVGINKKLALGGDKNALQMLDTLSPDWRTRSDADLAAQVGRLLQGSYDMRQLPASVLEGAAAPYLTWSKWSIGQYDSFMKYAIQPAMQGNMKPLMGQMLIGLLGGGAISAVQEWLNNREGKDITWKELEAWMQQNQGELGSDGGQLLAQKLLTMAQKMGTFGFAGDLVKMTLDAAAGGSAQGVATMPAVDAIYDVSKRTAAAIQALDDGEDFGLVMKALMKDSLVGHVQALRVARNWLDEDENLRYDDRRRQRLYDALSGLPSKGGAFSVNYSNLSEREFERGEITPETGEEALALVTRAREEATSREDYASRIRKLKTSQNQIMPSLDRQPMKAARYLSWLEGTEEGKGSETMRRYMIRKQEDEYRKSLIEGLSGLR